MNELDLFTAALAVANSAERKAFLDRECAGNLALRERLAKLVEAHLQSHPLLDHPLADPAIAHTVEAKQVDRAAAAEAGKMIAGRYKLLEAIGEGGMGTVWVAEQIEPVRRKVALKLIKAGMDSKSVLARFEAERQALAVMDHPNIAKVLDGGLTETGRPFFVMEYVKGVPITEYCDATRLSIPERLKLFAQVCQAVQHAHQKGIIHRDLKPSNILVAPYDDRPVPKVIDFGLAKAMHQSLTERTLHTAHETVLGTPLYMSPEQAQLNNIDVDTRSDIYSLGVLLYELLTGTTPLEKQRFKEAAWDEVKRIIREEEPPRPSMRLSSSMTLPSLAAGRQMEPARLTTLIRGELDWIVMKALEKDRTRRYDTATGFAADVQRYLDGEPVLAAPPSARYRLWKFATKHRAALTTAAAIALLLVAGVAVSSWQAVRATRAEGKARLAQQAEAERAEGERRAKEEAQAARDEEARERGYAEAIAKFVKDDFLALTSVEGQDRFGGTGKEALSKDTTLRELLDRAAEKLRARKDLDPRIEAELCLMVGVNFRGAGEAEKGIEFLQRAVQLREGLVGRGHFDTQDAMNSLAVAYGAAGHYARAVPLLEETLRHKKTTLGPHARSTLVTMDNLARAYGQSGKLELAITLGEETFKLSKATLGPVHSVTLHARSNLTRAYEANGKPDLALPLCEETLKLRKATLGPEHPETLTNMNDLAGLYMHVGKLDLALPLYEETLKLRKARLGLDHPDTLISMNDLAVAYEETGRLDLALPLYEETRKLQTAKLGPEHPHVLISMNNLATAYKAAGKLDVALPLLEEALKLKKAKLGLEHPETLICMTNLAGVYQSAKRLDLALPLFEETLKLKKAKLGPDHPLTLTCMNNLAGAYADAGKLDLALPLFEETLKIKQATLGPEHPETLGTMGNLGHAYGEANQGEKAAAIFKEFVAGQRKRAKPDDPRFAGGLAQVALDLLNCKQHTAAEELLRECLAIREKTQPDVWTTFNTKSQIGGALLGQKKYADAEPLLLAGYEGMKQREKAIPPEGQVRLPEALDRLIEFYTATDKPDEAKKWQAERAKYPPPTPRQESK